MPDDVLPPDGVNGDDPSDPPSNTPPPTGTPPTPPVTPPQPPPAATHKAADVNMTSDQLTLRLREAETAGEKKFLKSIGFEKASDVKAVLKLAKDQQDAELSDKERLEKQVAELKPKAEKADALEAWKTAAVDEQFMALPEATRAQIDEDAKGDADERMRLMRLARKWGVLSPPAPTTKEPPAPKAPATTSPPPAAPPSKAPPTKWDEYQTMLKKNPTQASIFLATNKHAVNASKPAAQ